MKCPKCGAEMHVDEHRRYALNMCYECGYIEGRMNDAVIGESSGFPITEEFLRRMEEYWF